MVKGVSKELENEVRSVLAVMVNMEPGVRMITHARTDALRRDAIGHLADKMALENSGSGSYRLTAFGREYWDQLNAPRWYWLRRNWFAASVAGATIVAASVSAGANIANLVI